MLLAIICVFFCCWGPKWVLNVLKRHQLDVLHSDQAFYMMVREHRPNSDDIRTVPSLYNHNQELCVINLSYSPELSCSYCR